MDGAVRSLAEGTTMKTVIVVGGGPAGLVSAMVARQKGHTVYLIEEENECGGLLRSFQGRDGTVFDYGNHFLRQTGNEALDALVFGEFDTLSDQWQRVPYLKNGNFFRGKLYEKSPFPNTNHLPKELYEKGIQELSELIPPKAEDCKNCEEFTGKTFGETFKNTVFGPSMRKFYGAELKELAPLAHHFFDMNRILAFTPAKSRELKKNAAFDERIGFHFSDEGRASVMNYYPTTGGIGQWIAMLVNQAKALGVEVLCGKRVAKVLHQNRRISSVQLASGENLPCDQLVWSVVPFPLLKAADLQFETTKVRLRTSNLFYFVYDKPVETECHYFVCMDDDLKAFRVSMYSNLRSKSKDKAIHAVCVEVNDNEPDTRPETLEAMSSELKKMKLLDANAKVLYQEARFARAGFPVFTNRYIEQSRNMREFLTAQFSNLILAGKGSGKTFFTQDTLLDTFQTSNERF